MQPARKVPQFKSFKPEPRADDADSRRPPRDSSTERRHRHDRDRDRHRHKDEGRNDKERGSHHARTDNNRDDGDSHRKRSHRRERSKDRSRDDDRDRDTDGDRERNPNRRDRSPRRRRRRSRTRSRSPRSKPTVITIPAQDPSILPWDAPAPVFQIDTKGDPHNITYGTIHRYNIPKYHRRSTRIVGLPRAVKIESDKGDGKGLVTVRVSRGDARVRGWEYALEHSRALRVKRAGEDDPKGFAEGWNYVELPGARKRKRSADAAADAQDYRSIEGMQKVIPQAADDDDLEAVPSSDDESGALNIDIKERTVQLSRLVDAQPQNIDAWLALTDHQETIVYGTTERRHRRKVRQGERQALEDVKLAVLDRALARNDGNPRLLLAYMTIAAGIWEPQKLRAKWEDVLSKHATTIELWEAYLNFRQTDFTSFKYRDCLSVYESCVARLRGRLLRYGAADDEKAALEEILLYILTRATSYMRQAGFSELALAIWQALLEMNSAPPREFQTGPTSLTDHERMLDVFSAFWDSEVLRIGEAKAAGWAAYTDDDAGEFADPKDLPEDYEPTHDLNLDDPDFFGAWLDKETALQGRLPARTTDEIEEDDPFRVILFSDMRSFLWRFQTPAAKSNLGDAFLAFAGLPAPTAFQNDAYLRRDLVDASDGSLASWFWTADDDENVKRITWVDGVPMDTERRGRVSRNPFIFRSPHLPFTPATLVSSNWWFDSVAPPAADEYGTTCIAMLKDYIFRVPDERLALVYFAVEVKRQASTSTNHKKIAKALLKRYSGSLRLWTAYAAAESAQGNSESAAKIYSTALSMAASFTAPQRTRTSELWLSWVWSLLDSGDEETALTILLAIPDGYNDVTTKTKERGVGAVLKCMRYPEDLQQRQAHEEGGVTYAELRCLLVYLTGARVPESFLKPLDELIADIHSRQPSAAATCDIGGEGESEDGYKGMLERAMMAKARVYYRYAAHARPYKPATFSAFLEDAVAKFPENTAFLSLYVWNEARSKIAYRVRRMLAGDNDTETGEGVARAVFRAWAEVQMGGGASAVRNVFERAVGSDRTRASVQLWVLYLRFEVRMGEGRRGREVLLRAVRACPWAKDMILSGFRLLRSVLSFGEMRKLYGVMMEKEMRVHVDIEEILEEWDRTNALALGEDANRGVSATFVSGGVAALGGRRISLPDDGGEEEDE
ncbi:hypothetical protein Dda_2109 [Drechslerella dactyloides]|uniref:DUF1740-domain-containing protein n=1 Tax=Drechslerella dactyloides TaxID=74499 RepID=A0AAD6NMP1_DREDA|nr:hypothetical protein Dda_2109 [Drechslerella dactyloides]